MVEIDLEAFNAQEFDRLIENDQQGNQQNFQELRDNLNRAQEQSIIKNFVADLMFYLIVIVLFSTLKSDEQCGIPVSMWITVHLTIFLLASILKLCSIIVIRLFYQLRVHWNIFSGLLQSSIVIAWLIYGNIIYFSPENNCKEIEQTKGIAAFMLFFLVLGYFQLLAFALIICCLPILLFLLYRQERNNQMGMDETQIERVANSLNRQEYDPSVFKHESECVICLTKYDQNDSVTQLKCHESHYFHSECISEWIKAGKNSCPICRIQIKNLSSLSERSN